MIYQEVNKQISNFGKTLKKNLNINVIFYNEDYSSNSAQAELVTQMQSGRKKKVNKEEIDRIAATLILQSYLYKLGCVSKNNLKTSVYT